MSFLGKFELFPQIAAGAGAGAAAAAAAVGDCRSMGRDAQLVTNPKL